MTTEEFIRQHIDDDTHTLALTAASMQGIDMAYALCQIQGWQIASRKLPSWAHTDGIVYPPHLSMEQCSSEQTALYKATILPPDAPHGSMTDLTGGFGVDAAILSRRYHHLTFVETNPELCQLARHNLPLLGVPDVCILNTEAEQVISELPHQDLIYIDPSRRDGYGRKMVSLGHCVPDLTLLQDTLLQSAHHLLVKLSPMLDIRHITHTLHDIHSIHVVSLYGECKEIVVHMSHHTPPAVPVVHAVNITQGGIQHLQSQPGEHDNPAYDQPSGALQLSKGQYLYEPNASIMKAQLFGSVTHKYGVRQLHPNSHLFVSDQYYESFPGRVFIIHDLFTLSKQHIGILRQLGHANISVRNFPLTVQQLRGRLHLADGGDTYLVATTISPNEQRVIICCRKPDHTAKTS